MPYVATADGTEIYYTEQGTDVMSLTNRTGHGPLRVPTYCRGRSTDAV